MLLCCFVVCYYVIEFGLLRGLLMICCLDWWFGVAAVALRLERLLVSLFDCCSWLFDLYCLC